MKGLVGLALAGLVLGVAVTYGARTAHRLPGA